MTPDQLLQLVVGPLGAIVAVCVALYFLWKLFREEQKENRGNAKVVATLTDTIRDLTEELKIWREAGSKRGSE